ncbi:hypothetical protein GCM10020001_089270 [Nonomuraea salmonea]
MLSRCPTLTFTLVWSSTRPRTRTTSSSFFGDDSESRAQLLHDHTGRPVLRMGGYMTANGTVIDERVWTIRESARHGPRLHLRLGDSLP